MAKFYDQAFTQRIVLEAFKHIQAVRKHYEDEVKEITTYSPENTNWPQDLRDARRVKLLLETDAAVSKIADEAGAQIAAYLRVEGDTSHGI